MREIIFIISILVFIYCFIKIEIYFIWKSRQAFKDLKEAYISFKKSKDNLHNLFKDKDL